MRNKAWIKKTMAMMVTATMLTSVSGCASKSEGVELSDTTVVAEVASVDGNVVTVTMGAISSSGSSGSSGMGMAPGNGQGAGGNAPEKPGNASGMDGQVPEKPENASGTDGEASESQKVQTEQVETLQKSQIHRIRQNSRCRKNQVVSRQPMEKRQRNKTRIIPIVRRVRTQVNRRQILRIMHHREAMEMHQVVWVVQRSSL